jgi:hypothetical protein
MMYQMAQYGIERQYRTFAASFILPCHTQILEQRAFAPTTSAVVIVGQIIITFILFLFLFARVRGLRKPLSLLLFCDPSVVLQTETAVSLLMTGRLAEEESVSTALETSKPPTGSFARSIREPFRARGIW